MATYSFLEPAVAGTVGQTGSFNLNPYWTPAQVPAWKRGDFLQLITTGALYYPSGGISTLATTAGPTTLQPININAAAASVTANGITVVGVTTANAPAQAYYIVLTWSGSTTQSTGQSVESLSGAEFVVNCVAGVTPKFYAANPNNTSVSLIVYASTYPQSEVFQGNAAGFGSGNSVTLNYPLTNSVGVNQSVTNPSANVAGLAVHSSNAFYFSGSGGSFAANERSLFGATDAVPPNHPAETYQAQVINPANTLFVLSLKQAYNNSMQGQQTAGLTLDANSGYFVADTTASHAILTIQGLLSGAQIGPTATGGPGDIGTRVLVTFNSGII
jgi:hypothetical protein